MELRQLRSFVAVAEALHFRRAAERLHLAQPALSRQIQNLESELGVTLLERTRRRVQLTEAGATLLRHARSLLTRAQEAAQAAQLAARGRTGWVRIRFVGSASYDVLPRSLKLFRDRSPGVEVILTEMPTGEQVQALREHRIHLGFVRPPIHGEGLALETIQREPLVVALPRGHALARRRTLNLRALAREPFVLSPRTPRPSWIDYIVGLANRAGFDPRIVQETAEIQTALSLVSAGVGISVVPGAMEKVPRRGVVYRRLSRPQLSTELLAVYRKAAASAAMRDFLVVVREIASNKRR